MLGESTPLGRSSVVVVGPLLGDVRGGRFPNAAIERLTFNLHGALWSWGACLKNWTGNGQPLPPPTGLARIFQQ